MLLELALWKMKITEQFDSSNDTLTFDRKMQRHTDSVTMVTIILPNVLSFLTDGDDGNNDDNGDNDSNESLSLEDNEDWGDGDNDGDENDDIDIDDDI